MFEKNLHAQMDSDRFISDTEIPDQLASPEQLKRMKSKYAWAASHSMNGDFLDVGCGSGIGLDLIRRVAKSVSAGDISRSILNIARLNHFNGLVFQEFDAQSLPFSSKSMDVLFCSEVIYYLPNPKVFLREAARVLRPSGKLLIVTCNKDVPAFHRSPLAVEYYGVLEMAQLLSEAGFSFRFFGENSVTKREAFLRPIKKAIMKTGLMPKSLKSRIYLKYLLHGQLVKIPRHISQQKPVPPPTEIRSDRTDTIHKVLFCECTWSGPFNYTETH